MKDRRTPSLAISNIWQRSGARLVLLLLLAVIAPFTAFPDFIGYRGLAFVALAIIVYLLWVPTRYLMIAAIGLLGVAAALYKPLEEGVTESTLRFVYYVLVLVVSRELLSALLSPFTVTARVRHYVNLIEQAHYQSMLSIASVSAAALRFVHILTTSLVRKSISILLYALRLIENIGVIVARRLAISARLSEGFIQTKSAAWQQYTAVTVPPFFNHVMGVMRYVLIPFRLLGSARITFFVFLTAAVVLPWFFQPGYLFLLDYVWPPKLAPPILPAGFITGVPHEWAFWLASLILPTHLVQKIVFTLPLFLAGLSASQLVDWLLREHNSKVRSIVPSLAAGVFYALNPFVVSRIFMGQVYFLLAYALVPWAVLAILWFLKYPSLGRGIVAGLTIVGVMISNAHHMILLPLLLIPLFIRPVRARQLFRSVSVMIIPGLIFVGTWLLFYSKANTSSVDPQGPWARLLQAPFSGNLWLDILSLTAHWKTDLLFAFPHELLSHFSLFVIALMVLMGVGIWYLWKQRIVHSWLVWQLLGIMGVSIFLASGVSHPFSEPAAGWLYHHVPFWIGMRDSAKFIANLALVEMIFLGIGVAALMQVVPAKRIVSSALLVLMLWFVSPAYGGFGGQILPAEYPESWQQWNDTLVERKPKPKMLVLPWHMYPALALLDNRPVINPAAHFFTNAEVIVGDNSEVGGIGESITIFSESTRPFSRKIEEALKERDKIKNFGDLFADDEITYIALLADAIDADTYQFLYNQQGLEMVFESPELVVWKNDSL